MRLTPGDKAKLRRKWAELHQGSKSEAMQVLLPAEERRVRRAVVRAIVVLWLAAMAGLLIHQVLIPFEVSPCPMESTPR